MGYVPSPPPKTSYEYACEWIAEQRAREAGELPDEEPPEPDYFKAETIERDRHG